MDLKGIGIFTFFWLEYVNPRSGVEHGPSYPPCWFIEFWRSCGLRNSSFVPLFHATFWFIRWSWVAGWWFGTFFIFPYIGNNHPNWLIYLEMGLKPPTRLLLLVESLFVWNPTIWFLAFSSFLGYTVIQQSFGVHSELIPRKRFFLMLVALLPQLFVVGSGSVILHCHGIPWGLGDEWRPHFCWLTQPVGCSFFFKPISAFEIIQVQVIALKIRLQVTVSLGTSHAKPQKATRRKKDRSWGSPHALEKADNCKLPPCWDARRVSSEVAGCGKRSNNSNGGTSLGDIHGIYTCKTYIYIHPIYIYIYPIYIYISNI